MAHPHIGTTGRIVRHAMGVLLLCWLRAFRAGALAGLGGFVVAEIAGMIASRQFPPPGVTHLVAIALGGALAYGVGITVAADELIVGIIDAIRLLLGEAEAGVRAAVAAAEHEVGDVRGGILRLAGLDRLARPRERDHPTGLSPETLAELATLAPTVLRRRVDARPVRVGELGTPEPATTPVLPPPGTQWSSPAAPPGAAQVTATAVPHAAASADAARDGAHASASAAADAAALLGGLAAPAHWQAQENPPPPADWHDPLAGRVAEEETEEAGIQPVDLFGAPPPAPAANSDGTLTPPPPVPTARPLPNATRPLGAITHPLDPRGKMWDHISQMLAGRPIEPLPEDPAPPEQDGEV